MENLTEEEVEDGFFLKISPFVRGSPRTKNLIIKNNFLVVNKVFLQVFECSEGDLVIFKLIDIMTYLVVHLFTCSLVHLFIFSFVHLFISSNSN